jgi:hypothetical protein
VRRPSGLPEVVFLIGAPRSGTTWLQLLLAQSPSIATVNETHLFNNYLRSFFGSWRTLPGNARQIGLSCLMSDAELEALIGGLCDQILIRIRATKPQASHVLEKTPDHARYWRDIIRLYPDAFFLHMVRDPRAVVRSLRAAATGWGAGTGWVGTGVVANARRWRRDVLDARELKGATPRHLEIRYEDLLGDGAATLERVFAWLGIAVSAEECRRWLDACRLDRLRAAAGPDAAAWPWRLDLEPQGFFGDGGTSWHDALSRAEIAAIECVASDLMEELGYAPVGGSGWRRVARVEASTFLEWLEVRLSRWRARI